MELLETKSFQRSYSLTLQLQTNAQVTCPQVLFWDWRPKDIWAEKAWEWVGALAWEESLVEGVGQALHFTSLS